MHGPRAYDLCTSGVKRSSPVVQELKEAKEYASKAASNASENAQAAANQASSTLSQTAEKVKETVKGAAESVAKVCQLYESCVAWLSAV